MRSCIHHRCWTTSDTPSFCLSSPDRPFSYSPPLRKDRWGCLGLSHVTTGCLGKWGYTGGAQLTVRSHGRHNAQDGFPFGPPPHPTPNHPPPHWYAGGGGGVPIKGPHVSFFESGGDSVLAIMVAARAAEQGMAFRIADMFQHPTVAQLADQPPPPNIISSTLAIVPHPPATAFGGGRTPPPQSPLCQAAEIHHRRSVGGGAASAFVDRATAENAPAAATPEDPEPEGDVPLSPAHAPSLPTAASLGDHGGESIGRDPGTRGPAHRGPCHRPFQTMHIDAAPKIAPNNGPFWINKGTDFGIHTDPRLVYRLFVGLSQVWGRTSDGPIREARGSGAARPRRVPCPAMVPETHICITVTIPKPLGRQHSCSLHMGNHVGCRRCKGWGRATSRDGTGSTRGGRRHTTWPSPSASTISTTVP